MNLPTQLLVALALALVCLIPSIGLLEGILREAKEREEKVYVLKLNKTELIINAFACFLELALGIMLLLIPVYLPISYLWLLLSVPISAPLIIDFLLFVNHCLYEVSRTVIYDTAHKTIEIQNDFGRDLIDLANNDFEVVRYDVRIRSGRGRFPGEGFGKTVIKTNGMSFEFSDLLLTNYNLFLVLTDHKKVTEVKRQFNFIK